MPVSRHALSRRLAITGLLSIGLSACAQSEATVSPFAEPTRADASALGKEPELLVVTTRRSLGARQPYFGSDRGSLTFAEPDFRRFHCLALAFEAAKAGGGMPAVLNAADEVAVETFLAGRLRFTDIPRVIETTMRAYKPSGGLPSFAEVAEVDQWAREKAAEMAGALGAHA